MDYLKLLHPLCMSQDGHDAINNLTECCVKLDHTEQLFGSFNYSLFCQSHLKYSLIISNMLLDLSTMIFLILSLLFNPMVSNPLIQEKSYGTTLAIQEVCDTLTLLDEEVNEILEPFQKKSLLNSEILKEDLYVNSTEEIFKTIFKEIDLFEEQITSAVIKYSKGPYGSMLRPMLKQIEILRTNLHLLKNHLVGITVLNNISKEVDRLTHLTENMSYLLRSEIPEKPGSTKGT